MGNVTQTNRQIIRTDRSRVQSYQRCKRLRYWEYSGGAAGIGITPIKLSIHLVIGLCFHAGAAMLLRESQAWLNSAAPEQLDQRLASLFDRPDGSLAAPIRAIEDQAVAETLAVLRETTAHGIQLDDQELLEAAPIQVASTGVGGAPVRGGDTAIQIDFSDFSEVLTGPTVAAVAPASVVLDDQALAQIEIANTRRAQGLDDYLLAEISALVEGMVRAYARRRLRPLLEQFEVLEVEREGEWKLAEFNGPDYLSPCPVCGTEDPERHSPECDGYSAYQINFMSRHDGLLLNWQTQQLYLLSYKTTGSWDRRKASDAETDMQGLSEAIDVENRLAEAWKIVQMPAIRVAANESNFATRLAELTETTRTLDWLLTQPEPPRVLGVRYEYILKGSRRKDDKDPEQPGRYVQDSPLVRAYRQDGITADDRKWATHYNWWDQYGKKSTINYRSWQKAFVQRYMTSTQWIDLLDSNQVQPDACTETGELMDTLAEQFIPPITVYRNDDALRDMLEQIEAQEILVAKDVAAVNAVKDDPGQMRSELNKRFQQSRTSCHYPGACAFIPICFGPAHVIENPESTGLYKVRVPNHPMELV